MVEEVKEQWVVLLTPPSRTYSLVDSLRWDKTVRGVDRGQLKNYLDKYISVRRG